LNNVINALNGLSIDQEIGNVIKQTTPALKVAAVLSAAWILRSGFGMTWKQNDEVDFTLRYDRRDRGNYDNQTISLKMRVMF